MLCVSRIPQPNDRGTIGGMGVRLIWMCLSYSACAIKYNSIVNLAWPNCFLPPLFRSCSMQKWRQKGVWLCETTILYVES